MHLSGSLCQAFLVVFALYIFGNPHSESTSEVRLTVDPGFYEVGGPHVFSIKCPQIGKLWPYECMDKTDRDIEQLLFTFRKCLIEMMTCAAGKARCQEKVALEKYPANQTYILYNNDTCFVQASRGFLIWLRESCQDYYRRVNMTHSNSTPLFPLFLCLWELFSRKWRGYRFYFEVF